MQKLENDWQQRRHAQQKAQATGKSHRSRQREQRRLGCSKARAALRNLKILRRKGYSVAEANRLDQSERQLRNEIAVSC